MYYYIEHCTMPAIPSINKICVIIQNNKASPRMLRLISTPVSRFSAHPRVCSVITWHGSPQREGPAAAAGAAALVPARPGGGGGQSAVQAAPPGHLLRHRARLHDHRHGELPRHQGHRLPQRFQTLSQALLLVARIRLHQS